MRAEPGTRIAALAGIVAGGALLYFVALFVGMRPRDLRRLQNAAADFGR